MNRSITFYLLLLIGIFLQTPNNIFASHIQGADVSYEYLGNNQYKFILNVYRDCTSSVTLGSPVNITYTQTGSFGQCAQNASAGNISGALTLVSGPNEVSQLCPNEISNSNCNTGGTLPGTQKYVLEKILSLPFGCGTNSQWRVSFSFSARNAAITTLQTPDIRDLYLEVIIRSNAANNNNSPVFTSLPVPYVCFNQPVNYTQGAFDSEGDSLVFTAINPLEANAAAIPYVAPYSVINPLATSGGFSVNAATGQLSYTPTQQQVAVIALKIDEFRGGQLLGSTMRDLQVIVRNCNTVSNPPTSTPPQNLSGGSVNNGVINVCPGTPISFQFNATGNNITVTDDHLTSIPNSNVSYSGSGNSVAGNFSWTPTSADLGLNVLSVTVSDNTCPINSVNVFSYPINISNSACSVCPNLTLSTPSAICNNTTLSLSTLTGSSAPGTWSIVNTPSGSNPANITGINVFNSIGKDAGNYTLRYTLSNPQAGCPSFLDITLTVNPIPNAAISGATSVCLGNNITLAANGGTGYLWNNGSTTASITVNPTVSTSYAVTITANNSCTASTSRTININSIPSASISPISSVICNGFNTSLTASGGVSYTWNTGATTAILTINPIQNSTYSVTVLDANSCSATASRNVTVNSNPTGAITGSLNICTGNTTNLVASGGVSYVWNNNSTSSNINVNPTQNTNYSVTVTDNNGCKDTVTVSVNISPKIQLNVFTNNPSCGNNNGSITVNVTSSGNSSFSWSNNANTGNSSIANNLSAGIYSFTISQNSCVFDTSIVLNATGGVILNNISSTTPSCFSSDGIMSFEIVNGTSPYTLVVDTGGILPIEISYTTQGVKTINNLNSGSVVLSVVDAQGCLSGDTYIIPEPQNCCVFQINTNIIEPTCGNNNGQINISVSSGSGNYSYSWSNNVSVGNSSIAGNLSAGSYSVTISDEGIQNCTLDTFFIINNLDAPVVDSVVVSNVNCYGENNGTITVYASGGNGTLSILWSNNQNQFSQNNLIAGNYSFTITDQSSCSITDNAIIIQPDSFSVQLSLRSPICGQKFGSATANATGATPPYNYNWSNNNINSASNNFLEVGSYNLSITDSNGCNYLLNFDVVAVDTVYITSSSTSDDISTSLGEGTATISMPNGTPPFIYEWDNGQNTETATGLVAGTYEVTIEDSNKCKRTTTITISTFLNIIENKNDLISIYPNPFKKWIAIDINNSKEKNIDIYIHNVYGQEIYNESKISRLEKQTIDLSNYSIGLYFVTVKIENKLYNKRITKIE
jgi:hypothetical protein